MGPVENARVLDADRPGSQPCLWLLPAPTSPRAVLSPRPFLGYLSARPLSPDTLYTDLHLCFLTVSA